MPTVNVNAIDTQVTTLAADAVNGIYILEQAAGGAITVDTVAVLTVTIDDVVRVNFNSTTTSLPESRTLAALEDLRTSSNGPIKLVSEDGTVTIEPGADTTFGVSADGTGNVLLEARGAGSDLILNGNVVSGTGLISVTAGRDVIQNASISSSAGLGDFGITAGRDIALGRIDATAVVLLAGRDILDNNGGGVVNVTADTLLMIADTDSNGTGRIGSADLARRRPDQPQRDRHGRNHVGGSIGRGDLRVGAGHGEPGRSDDRRHGNDHGGSGELQLDNEHHLESAIGLADDGQRSNQVGVGSNPSAGGGPDGRRGLG